MAKRGQLHMLIIHCLSTQKIKAKSVMQEKP